MSFPDRLPLDLDWRFRSADDAFQGPAQVPGNLHLDLLESGLIADPFTGLHEREQLWIGERDWIYEASFDVPAAVAESDAYELVFEGLDTLARVFLNGEEVGRADNMFRTWRFAARHLRPAGNSLRIVFASAMAAGRERQQERFVVTSDAGAFRLDGGQWLRKMQCNFGWDWGPQCVTCGIWKPLYLERRERPQIRPPHIATEMTDAGATVTVQAPVQGAPAGSSLQVALTYEGTPLTTHTVAAGGTATLTVKAPKRWWPYGHGAQPLYDLELVLRDAQGQPLDRLHRRIGLRSVELVRTTDDAGESFGFRVNGRAIFAKGANWIPADVFVPRIPPERYRQLLQSARDAHMNMIRVWGGGLYEPDLFYDLCDELGLLVWQDFMFACSAYPAHDDAWLDNVAAEAREQVTRLHHHPCLALWCGNNEIEQFEQLIGEDAATGAMHRQDYDRLFAALLADTVAELHPEVPYWQSSPHSPEGIEANEAAYGDKHYWGVWWGLEPFASYARLQPRFASEFGFQSFPCPATILPLVPQAERNLSSRQMDHYQRGNTRLGSGNGTILAYLSAHFRLPPTFESLLTLSQLLQGLGLQQAVEAWRAQPTCAGALYWQLNDCWPGASWSTIDYTGRWKASHYLARRFFAPLLATGTYRPDRQDVAVTVLADLPLQGAVSVSLTTTDTLGRPIDTRSQVVEGLGVRRLQLTLPVPAMADHRPTQLLCWLKASSGGAVAENLVLACPPKHLELVDPGLEYECGHTATGTTIRLRATRACALWAWLDTPAVVAPWSDNFVHLRPGKDVVIHCADPDAAEQLQPRSLYDLEGR